MTFQIFLKFAISLNIFMWNRKIYGKHSSNIVLLLVKFFLELVPTLRLLSTMHHHPLLLKWISINVDIRNWVTKYTNVRFGELPILLCFIPFEEYRVVSNRAEKFLHLILELMISFQWRQVCDPSRNAWCETPLLPITYMNPYLIKHSKRVQPLWPLLRPFILRKACVWKLVAISWHDYVNTYSTCLQKRPAVKAVAHLP